MYIEHFGAQLYKDKAWYGGVSPGESSYQLIEAGGLKLLFLHLMHDTPPAEPPGRGGARRAPTASST